eukprot:2012953-Rhodomonas_salina.1
MWTWQGVSAHFGLSYMMESLAMFDEYKDLREKAQATNNMATVKTKWTEDKTAEDITTMTDVLQDRENGRVITRLSVMRSTMIKNAAGGEQVDPSGR